MVPLEATSARAARSPEVIRATDRRGRILTTAPDAMIRLVQASRAVNDQPVAYPFAGLADAESRFASWLEQGVIRRIFCDVDDGPRLTAAQPKG